MPILGGVPVVHGQPGPRLLRRLRWFQGIPGLALHAGLAGQAGADSPLHSPVHTWKPEADSELPLGGVHPLLCAVPDVHHPVPQLHVILLVAPFWDDYLLPPAEQPFQHP